MEFSYQYRGRELAEVLVKKIAVLNKQIVEKELLLSEFNLNNPIGHDEILGDDILRDHFNGMRNKRSEMKAEIDSIKQLMNMTKVMLIEMNRNPREKYNLSLDDLMLIRTSNGVLIE